MLRNTIDAKLYAEQRRTLREATTIFYGHGNNKEVPVGIKRDDKELGEQQYTSSNNPEGKDGQHQRSSYFDQNDTNTFSDDPLTEIGHFMTGKDGSAYTSAITDIMRSRIPEKDTYRGVTREHRFYEMDNTRYTNLSYSAIILALISSNTDKVYYNIILLEATGDRPMDIGSVIEEYRYRKSRPYVAGDAIDRDLQNMAISVLSSELRIDSQKLVSTDGVVLPFEVSPEPTSPEIMEAAVQAYNGNVGRHGKDTNLYAIITVSDIVGRNNATSLNLNVAYNTGGGVNPLGKPCRTDFELLLSRSRPTMASYEGPNSKNRRVDISATYGYVEALPTDTVINGRSERSIIPMIILNSFQVARPTFDLVLFAIVSAMTFTNRNNLLSLLSSLEWGPLNKIVGMEIDPSDPSKRNDLSGAVMKFKDPKFTQDKVYNMLELMTAPKPIIAIEVEIGGSNFSQLSPLAALDSSPKIEAKANEDIIVTAENTVDKDISADYFHADRGIMVPVGEWYDTNNNRRDIRDIDLATVCEYSKSPELIFKWIASNRSPRETGIDPYLTKLEVLAALPIKATITGCALRIPISGKFLQEYTRLLINSGYNPASDIGNANYTNYQAIRGAASAYADAMVQNVDFGVGPQGTFNGGQANFVGSYYR